MKYPPLPTPLHLCDLISDNQLKGFTRRKNPDRSSSFFGIVLLIASHKDFRLGGSGHFEKFGIRGIASGFCFSKSFNPKYAIHRWDEGFADLANLGFAKLC
jgi:hypothetical protein